MFKIESTTLSDYGFKRFTCSKCGSTFWSIVERNNCGDVPCGKYEFLIKDHSRAKPMDLDEARAFFINFFVEKGHGYFEPYPVVARWRNDLYLTIASIVVFQPLVTDGIIDPPHNPLVISQPCVRLEDIDNVGLTFGRHLTSFEMGGHHAFNKKDRFIYWVDETLSFAYEFFTKRINVEPENIVFKESWWEGGGNAGPAYEVIVDGLELATLVFMQYKVVENKYVPMDVRVVDTGYGVERLTWFTSREPTAYHAIFRSLVETYGAILNVESIPKEDLRRIAYLISDKGVRNISEFKRTLVENDLGDYVEKIVGSIHLYTILDHVKTILLLLSQGVVPSNSGEGYLARLIVRRLLRLLMKLKVEVHELSDTLLGLVDEQIGYWRGRYVYGDFIKRRDYITEALTLEVRKFVDTVTRGVSVIDRYLKKGSLGFKELVEIYDSHGIPPDIVEERASKLGLKIEVPNDFYSRIAQIHGGPGKLVKEEKRVPLTIVEAGGTEATRLLFHENPYLQEVEAKVLDVRGNVVVLDQTIFYPKSGGQDNDVGFIYLQNRGYRVVDVVKVDDKVVHILEDEPNFKPGDKVTLRIDWERRYTLMKHHTATHILLGVLRKSLGPHVHQAGVEKTVEKARLDVTHHKTLSKEEVEAIEREVNRVVNGRINLVFKYADRFNAEKQYGLSIYQGGAIYEPILRIVEIPGVDVEACFGTHVSNTSEIGGFKILKVDRIQDGVIRFEYTVGTNLPGIISNMQAEINNAIEKLGFTQQDLATVARKAREQLDEYKRIIHEYRRVLREMLIKEAGEKAIEMKGLRIVILEERISDRELIRSVVEELSLKNKDVVILHGRSGVELATHPENVAKYSLDFRRVLERVKEKYGDVKGGGKVDHVVINMKIDENTLRDIVNIVIENIK